MATDKRAPRRELLTVTAAADMLGCHRATIYRAIRAGDLPALRLRSKAIRIDRNDLQAITKPITPESK